MNLPHKRSADLARSTNRSQPAQPHERVTQENVSLPLKPPKSSAVSKASNIPQPRFVNKGTVSSHPKIPGLEDQKSPSTHDTNRHNIASSQSQAQDLTDRREKLPQTPKQPGHESSRVRFSHPIRLDPAVLTL